MRSARQDWRSIACPGSLVLLGLGFALVPLAQGEIFFYWDNAHQHYLQTEFLHRALRSGSIPHWWFEVGSGIPTMAEGQAAHYHPIRLLLTLLFSPAVAFMLEIGVYFAIAGLGTYFFLREFRLAKSACLVGGLCQMFGSFSIVSVNNIALHRSFCLMPLAMLFAERFVTRQRFSYGLLTSLILGVQLLAGHPTFMIVTVVATATHTLCRILQRSWHLRESLRATVWQVGQSLAQWGVVAVLGIGIAAIQAIPTFFHIEQSIRQGGLKFEYAVVDSQPASIWYFPQLIFPYFYNQGDWLETTTWWGSYFNETPYIGIYAGTLPALLALLALWWRRPWPDPGSTLTAGLLVSTCLAMGAATPLYPALWSLPGMNGMRFPCRLLMWSSFSLACLAALGLHRLLARSRLARPRLRDSTPFLLFAGFLLALALFLWKKGAALAAKLRVAEDFQSGIVISLALFAIAVGLAWGLPVVRRRYQGILLGLILIFVSADLWVFRMRSDYARTVPIEQVMSPPSVVEFLKTDQSQFRVMSLISVERCLNRHEDLYEFLQADTCTLWGIESAEVWCSLMLKRYYALHEGILWELLNSPDGGEKLAGILAALNIKYIVAPESVVLRGWEKVHQTARATTWKNPIYLPRAFLVSKTVPEKVETRDEWFNKATYQRLEQYHTMVANWFTRIEDAQIVDNILAAPLDYRTTAVVAGKGLPALPDPDPESEVRVGPEQADAMTFEVESRNPAFLVIANNHYPGWTATVNGQPAQVYRANYVEMGVLVPAGRSEVVLRFVTPGFRLGLLATCVSLGLTLGGLFIARSYKLTSKRKLGL